MAIAGKIGLSREYEGRIDPHISKGGRLRTPRDEYFDEANCADCCKAKYGAVEVVRHWGESYRKNGGRFKF